MIAFCTARLVVALVRIICLHRGVFRPKELGLSVHLLGLAASSHGVCMCSACPYWKDSNQHFCLLTPNPVPIVYILKPIGLRNHQVVERTEIKGDIIP